MLVSTSVCVHGAVYILKGRTEESGVFIFFRQHKKGTDGAQGIPNGAFIIDLTRNKI